MRRDKFAAEHGALASMPRDRRKAYYHGKYDKELVLFVSLGIFLLMLL